MKRLSILAIFVFSTSLFAQRGSPANTGIRNYADPIPPPTPSIGNITSGVFSSGYANRGYPGHVGVGLNGRPGPGRPGGGGGGPHSGRTRTIVVPYAYPIGVPVTGYYGDPYAQGDPNYNGGGGPQQQSMPPVIINQTFVPETAHPVMRDYSESELPESAQQQQPSVRVYDAPMRPRERAPEPARSYEPPPSDEATIYLIAFKDSSVHQAIGYWLEGNTLHYVTPQGSVNRITMDQVDRPLSERLNRERNMEFDLRAR
jgi:hypothetical protein